MQNLHRAFGDRLRDIRRSADLRQDELALATGLGRTTISNIEAGRQGITIDVLYRLATALGVQPQSLLPAPEDVAQEHEPEGIRKLTLNPEDAKILADKTRRAP